MWVLTMISPAMARIMIAIATIGAVAAVGAGPTGGVTIGSRTTLPFGFASGLLNGIAAMPGPPVIVYYMGMAATPEEFLASWKNSYIFAESRTIHDLETVMRDLEDDAKHEGISRSDLDQAAGGDLRQHIIGVLKKQDL